MSYGQLQRQHTGQHNQNVTTKTNIKDKIQIKIGYGQHD
jgi:hypothetical protein